MNIKNMVEFKTPSTEKAVCVFCFFLINIFNLVTIIWIHLVLSTTFFTVKKHDIFK